MAKKKPHYRLQPVLEQRQRRRDEAQRQVAAAEQALEQQMRRLAEMMECKRQLVLKKDELRQEFESLIGRPGVALAEESVRYDRYQTVIDEKVREMDGAIGRQRVTVRQAESALERAKAALLEAITELRAMEKHKENWEAEVRREEREREQEQQEELGQTMWLQQRQQARRRAQRG
ncbi:MAG: hypothetical protein D6776_07560 [Planctomycetota bacterium]|nr:MAG: hypothetical protein D6776_07560 [Planctomycetota bacterium]